ncbi:pyruvate flavodoxin/ferredoxin oxidoreductase domain protein [Dethiobacter alkaliphilus]|uniref:Pyruvate flavodoxin/ferredoxin oxidoreductase domain protein n=1 Tax=Dethiobacter alkaliphilus AHT 1 TaxID=555088 RepID=C0GJX2_DETAL|nr:pyruvate flavodoxin/ferredoxin oxidoreductase domain protein [Dethiobacter alkaliphilus]EEG76341.1 pyruvate flavodoxin/ferredoxin oxidoreductase domain protein [Dethiobacter alkaliphilus AHT 1]
MTKKIITGNEAVAHAVRLSRTQVISAYPITPQTTVMETLARMWAAGDYGGEYVTVESENSALAYCIGAAYAGARAFTATSAHGLAYMHELIHWAAGARLPIVMTNANRAMGAPWCIEPDQLDTLSQRDTGWIQLYCADVQEILDTVLLAFGLAEKVRLPVLVSYDGFYLSHTYEAVEIPDQKTADSFLPAAPQQPAFDVEAPENRHGLVNSEQMAKLMKARFAATAAAGPEYAALNDGYLRLTGRGYPAVEYTGNSEAKTVFVTAGSMAQTIKSFISGRDEALVRIKQFRPFPVAELRYFLSQPQIQQVIIVDRNASMGVGGIFAQEVRSALYGLEQMPQTAEFNLAGGLDLTPKLLEKCLDAAGGGEKLIWAVNLL